MTPRLIRRGLEIQTRYQISFWDASIIAAASSAGCSVMLSEDLSAGQVYAGVGSNPFARCDGFPISGAIRLARSQRRRA